MERFKRNQRTKRKAYLRRRQQRIMRDRAYRAVVAKKVRLKHNLSRNFHSTVGESVYYRPKHAKAMRRLYRSVARQGRI